MEPTDKNMKAWDEVHRRRSVAMQGRLGLPPLVRGALGDLQGRRVLNLQCATGESAADLAELGALVTGVDISAEALEVARINVDRHRLGARVTLIRSDLYDAVRGPYDLIVCNPPYVNTRSMSELPAEYRAEPALALAGGADGMDLIRRIVREAPSHMTSDAVLVLEIGHERRHFERAFPRLEVAWLETSAGDNAVLLATRDALAAYARKG